MRPPSTVRAFLLFGVAAFGAGCGFDPQPESGKVACKPGGRDCCPEGYICVGRGASTAAGPSAGTCWNKRELPPSALSTAHDYTPANPRDPLCLVTDWLPPVPGMDGGAVDGGAIDTGRAMDLGRVAADAMDAPVAGSGGDGPGDTAVLPDTAWAAPTDLGLAGPEARDAAVPDVSIVDSHDSGRDGISEAPALALDAGADWAGPVDGAPADTGGVGTDTGDAAGGDASGDASPGEDIAPDLPTDPAPASPEVEEVGTTDAPILDDGDAHRDVAAEAPAVEIDGGIDGGIGGIDGEGLDGGGLDASS